MHSGARKVAFLEKLIKLSASKSRSHEDDDLVKFEGIQQVVKLAVLLAFVKLDKVLLKTVQCQLLLIIDIDFQRVLHELLADQADVLGERSRKHHDLLVRRGSPEDGLNVVAHVWVDIRT